MIAETGISITEVRPDGASGTATTSSGIIRLVVTGDEGRFDVIERFEGSSKWSIDFPATLARGTYSVTARLLRATATDSKTLKVDE